MSELHTVLPVQHLRPVELAAPQRRLMLAVIQTVLDDFDGTAFARANGNPTREQRHARLEAIAYLQSRDRSWPFSFDNICEAIGLDADGIRRKLAGRLG